ncbi:potassium channel subfamily K member 18 [Danio rerio]|uniref:Potassium channel subfamily K member 18 n=1 Tax=Danio rerio TaxID=7955 RepID=D7NVC0_DANRE|nr:potassium channel subfamily K member 18 [Danio rerio]ADH03413.2 TRESK potassium channel [Danio rerio]|eukprot:NP_001177236.2 potassium channel subfamily K member 18 [Danio rerio]
MSVSQKRQFTGRCSTLFWRLFPHVFLILSLVLYAVLGALVFRAIEYTNPRNESEEILSIVQKVMEIVQNHTDASEQKHLINKAKYILDDYCYEKERDHGWTFFASLFFCCTVFTTVGYGRIYPLTSKGKVACVLYAMVGIPLMLLVISDVGDLLAVLLSKAYTRLNLFFRRWIGHQSWRLQSHEKTSALPQAQADTDGTYKFNQDVVVLETTNNQQVIQTRSSIRRGSFQLRNNKEIFDRIIVRESFRIKGTLSKSCSCPELDRVPTPKDELFNDIGQEMEQLDVPLLVILLMVFAYMVICSQILKCWEKQMDHSDAFYFTFITLTTIGFGDIVPEHPKFFMVTFLFIITGMAIMSMAFKLGQSQIVCFYRRCIKSLSMGKVRIHNDLNNN